MSKKNEDSIERFFRKAVTQQDTTFRERDWQQMEKMLDVKSGLNNPVRSRSLKRIIYSLAGLIIIGGVYFLALKPDRLIQNHSVKEMQAAGGAEAPGKLEKKDNPSAGLLSDASFIQPTFKLKKDHQDRNNKSSMINPLAQEDNHANQISDLEKNTSASDNAVQNPESIPGNKSGNEGNEVRIINEARSDEGAEISSKKEVDKPILNTAEPEKVDIEESPKDIQEAEQKNIVKLSRWNFALAISPDFSTTALGRYSTPGHAFGVLIGYRFLKKFTITSGLVRSSKKYEGYGKEYQPPQGYWSRKTNGIVPDEINGACEVLEIPLLIQFDVLQKAKSRFYISTGVSSYRMLHEHYKYQFDTPNPGAANEWSSPAPTSYPFSIGHLSLSYERSLSSRLSVGIEPYLKVPFAGIGWSKINLYTTGAYINVRYHIFKKETPPVATHN
jgi:hypothetical protein